MSNTATQAANNNAQANIIKPNINGKFTVVIPVRWGDIDAQNHVNNATYFRYFEEARIQLFGSAGLPMPSKIIGMLAHISCDFILPIEYPKTIVVETTVKKIGNTSMTYESIIKCHQDASVIYAKSVSVIVGASVSDGKPIPWSQSVLDSFAKCFV